MDTVAEHCRVGPDDGLLIRWPTPLRHGERVVLRHGSSGEVRAEALSGDRRSVTLAVAGLATGAWELLLGADRPLVTDDPGFSLDGLRAYAASARHRAARVVRLPDGRAVLDVREVTPHAEVETVHPRDGEIEIGGRLAYAGPRPGDARLVAVARDGDDTAGWHVRLDGTEFRVCLDVRAFAACEPHLWDLWLDAGDVHARLATFLDDSPGKRGTLSYPRQVTASGDREMSVRPYYTLKDELSIACHRVDAAP
ncbi:hypothetical protein E1293_17425 [Actinomadura darangshiensis]|uniref:Uncharacterized protein n=1 Tax=Actinomadura darangshiensis TaxID=705336 RepID=A0A4V2YVM4_9ACTN|nr:hypothetical protein [Actinomadura darangshiensis]TDD81997.1 hypothetical protein E1293_17425 [Actinomadura darangshiensis]